MNKAETKSSLEYTCPDFHQRGGALRQSEGSKKYLTVSLTHSLCLCLSLVP